MGFYAPAQIVRDAREHGVEIRPTDINISDTDARLETGQRAADHIWPRHAEMVSDIKSVCAVRLGFNQIKGIKDAEIGRILARRGNGYRSIQDLWRRADIDIATLETLARADAFASLGLNRRDALWAIKGLKGADGAATLPLFSALPEHAKTEEPDLALPAMSAGEEVIHDYRALTLSLKGHPMAFLRDRLTQEKIISAERLSQTRDGSVISLAGLVLVRQRPGTASGVIFATLEDETGHANIIVWPKVFETYRRIVLGARVLKVTGQVQRQGLVIHIVARQLLRPHPLAFRSDR